VQHHVQEEEGEMLPKAQQQLGAESERLGALMPQRKQELQQSKSSGEQPREASRASQRGEVGQAISKASTFVVIRGDAEEVWRTT